MQFAWWLTGIMASFVAIRFVWRVFKRLASKENLDAIVDNAANGMKRTATNMGNYFKQRKQKKEEQERPIVTIR